MANTVLFIAAFACIVDLIRQQMASGLKGKEVFTGPTEQRPQRAALHRRIIFYALALYALHAFSGWLNYL